MYSDVRTNFKYSDLELDILSFWEENKIFEKSIRADAEAFIFFEGPPTANGKPGIHHVMSRTIKDVVNRYKTLQGFRVERKAGWDTHGLPVEIQVEKELKIQGREQVLSYGIDKFNKACHNSVFKYKSLWDNLTTRMAYWVDLKNPYITCDNNYIESVWWILNQFFEKNLIYKGYKIQPYCPACGTSLSSHEVSQGYKDVKDLTATVRFKLSGTKETYFLAWTTTPWTLPSNMALAVGSNIDYVKIKHLNTKNIVEFLILAKDLLNIIDDDYEIIENYMGTELKGLSYDPLFNFVKTNKNSHKILNADFVCTSEGTGIVHMAPAYGDDDYRVCQNNNIPVEIIVQADGTFNEKSGEFSGLNILLANAEIVTNLKYRGLLFRSQKIVHSYPHCWRHGTPLFYYAQNSWFIKTTKFREKMIKNNRTINWYPKDIGEGRFGKWLENNIDWSLSRKRYWGTPLNIWLTDDGKEMKSISSINELKSEVQKAIDAGFMQSLPLKIDLHKPQMDTIILVSESGKKMKRTPEVIDCWFDSGAMPFAQWHYPFENNEMLDHENAFPADFICEGIDQTRGWFYTLLAISTMLFDKAPYKNVIVNNLILDKEGQKMSKSRGNTVDPTNILEKYGADTLRWFFITSSQPWIPKQFDENAIQEVQRKFVGTLVNTYAFYVLYANVDKFENTQKFIPYANRPEIDRWIISLLYSKIKDITKYYDNYDLTAAGRVLSTFFIRDVSNWYVRRNRRRFWKGEINPDKIAAYQTLYEILMAIIKMASPIMPFLTENIYQNLKLTSDPESIHLSNFPSVSKEQESIIDKHIEHKMMLAQQIVELTRALRSENQIKIRQPLASISVFVETENEKIALRSLEDIICDELNVKSLILTNDVSNLALRRAKANFQVIGPKYGKLAREVALTINNLTEKEISNIESNLVLKKVVDNKNIKISRNYFDIIHEKKEDLVVSTQNGITVALDTRLSDVLIYEGITREFISKLQNLRKEKKFDVIDRINVEIFSSQKIRTAIERQMSYIKTEILAEDIKFINDSDTDSKITLENETITVKFKKARGKNG